MKQNNQSVYSLSDHVENAQIIKDGVFETIGSAKAAHGSNLLCYAMNYEYLQIAIDNPHVSCIITLPSLAQELKNGKAIALHPEPDILFGKITNEFISSGKIFPAMTYGIDSTARIHPTAIVSPKCRIGKNVTIGRFSIIEDYSVLDDNVVIGDNVIIGTEGFYFKREQSGRLIKFLHAGGVHLEQNVEIMSGSIIQRAHDATFTVIGEGTKISVGVNVGHSSIIGKHNMITGKVQIAGRVRMGDYCWIGTAATISDSIVIGNHAEVKIGSVVVKNIKDGDIVSGNFAIPHSTTLKNFIKFQR